MYKWNEEKNLQLISQIAVSFYDILEEIKRNAVLDNYKHPNSKKYPNQFILIVRLKSYVHYVPYIFDGEDIFLKNIIPGRKLNKIYKD